MSSGARLPALVPYELANLPAELIGGVIAVGNFDGVHRGHAALLGAARAAAALRGVPCVVLTFEPHPRSVLRPDTPVFRLTPLPAKARLLKALGVDGLIVAHFDRAFSAIPAEAFIAEILVGRLKLKEAIVGHDFHFGKGRAGTPALLADAGARLGFAVTAFGGVSDESGELYSSRAIRKSLENGDVAAANRRLGYRWFAVGEVVAGDRRGRELGYPTANLTLPPDCRLRHGIYAVRVQRPDGAIFDGVASYGRRPTFGDGPPLLEAHLFGFSGDLYGQEIAVAFVGWIRPELKFASVADLVAEMDRDSAEARRILAGAVPESALDKALAKPG